MMMFIYFQCFKDYGDWNQTEESFQDLLESIRLDRNNLLEPIRLDCKLMYILNIRNAKTDFYHA